MSLNFMLALNLTFFFFFVSPHQNWHPEHFVCTTCKSPLLTGTFYKQDGLPYCEKDFAAQFSPKCDYCSKPMLASYMETGTGKKFHPECYEPSRSKPSTPITPAATTPMSPKPSTPAAAALPPSIGSGRSAPTTASKPGWAAPAPAAAPASGTGSAKPGFKTSFSPATVKSAIDKSNPPSALPDLEKEPIRSMSETSVNSALDELFAETLATANDPAPQKLGAYAVPSPSSSKPSTPSSSYRAPSTPSTPSSASTPAPAAQKPFTGSVRTSEPVVAAAAPQASAADGAALRDALAANHRLEADLHLSLKRAAAAESNIEGLETQLADTRRKIQEHQRENQALKTSLEGAKPDVALNAKIAEQDRL